MKMKISAYKTYQRAAHRGAQLRARRRACAGVVSGHQQRWRLGRAA
jgi:hypothetical protein